VGIDIGLTKYLSLVQISSKEIELFYKNIIESSLDEDSDREIELLFTVANMMHDHFLLPKRRGGSSAKRKVNTGRDRVVGHTCLMRDYFHPTDLLYDVKTFRGRYQLSRNLFLDILDGVRAYDDYFEAKLNATVKVGFSSYQKRSVAIRQVAYGVPGDLVDEYLHMSESTCIEAKNRFCNAVISVFVKVYPREPTTEDNARLLSMNKKISRFPRMMGSID
jgi:hypothetical protein